MSGSEYLSSKRFWDHEVNSDVTVICSI